MQLENFSFIGKWTVSYTSINNENIYFDEYKFSSDKLHVYERIQVPQRIQTFSYQYKYDHDSLEFQLVNSYGHCLELKLEILSDRFIKIIKNNDDYTILERVTSA